jgi:ribulose-5-phosphate 4-epimerase/fuculose-1-phosphate aldolase
MTMIQHPAPKPATCSDEEWALRCQLADCFHLVEYLGWGETIFSHISARLPGTKQFLLNPFGLLYDEVTPANLVKVDLFGNKVEESPYDANPAGFALHGVIHEAREDVHCVIHTHTNEVSAIALKRAGFGHDDFYGAQLFGRVGYHAFEGITLFPEERTRMLASLGDKHVLVLRNHGVAVGEADLPRMMLLAWIVQRAAEIQCMAGAMAGDNVALPEAISQRTADIGEGLVRDTGLAEKWFAAMVRRVNKTAFGSQAH